ncbi:SusC/RagA family TonB-linked outer membrane protein [Mucilaginibacter flavus]|uniref:SusC/RagA family TonB-linked outer membrane protein n=1 Tax=Mucilaginibacter flavus TaxID=931504 RepID=UPI0025B3AB47|nr:SusC/RagA family TonB-linked outer membrane protein [Mucilaginibacter flavus]MDN3584562.1 SusC/RagA family TonB-linked outer membrane protein [Mucilaginibacter flavus]
MKKKILYSVLALLCPIFVVTAQTPTAGYSSIINGIVVDELEKPLPMATIKIHSSNTVSLTGVDGKFILNIAENTTDTLIVSFIGYQTTKLPINGTIPLPLTIHLKAETGSLNEVQIIGYGTTTKRLNTGSVSTITSKDIEQQPVTNVLSALSGKAPGVYVQTNNGLPGGDIAIQIRGPGSLTAGTNPLYIIDGVPYLSSSLVANSALGSGINGAISPLNSINPGDIESISILKDADATAIYGSRGANGVVLITTKKGANGKIKTDFNLYEGVAKVANFPKLLNLTDYLAIRKEAFINDGLIPSSNPLSPSYAPDLTIWDTQKSTDWAKYILGGTGHITNVQTSISGGDAQSNFDIGANYRTESSVLPGTNQYQRGGVHMSLQHTSQDGKFNISMSTSYTQDNNNLVNPAIALSSDILLPPDFPIYNPDGTLNFLNGNNPLASVKNTSHIETENIITNALIGYKILPGLQIKLSTGLNNLSMKQVMVNPKAAVDPQYQPVSYTIFGSNSNKSFLLEPQLVYNLQMNKSKFDLLFGGTWQETQTKSETIFATNFNSESLLENLASAATLHPSNADIDYKYVSVFGRITYNFDDRYIINASVRRDGSSRFGPGNQFGNFGAVGIGWLFSNEHFIKNNLNWLSYGKLRGSFGITGNDQISDYQYLSTYQSSNNVYQNVNGLAPTKIANANFRWESNKKLDAGLEIGLLKDRILLTTDYFENRSGNQLVNYALPYLTGFNSYEANIPAVIKNTGWEIQLLTKNIVGQHFRWSTNFNITTTKNRLVNFPGLANSGYANIYIVGESISRAYGFKYAGADPQTGVSLYQLTGGGTSSNPSFDNFYKTIGDNNPSLYGGISNAFTYKNFQLDFSGQFAKHSLAGGILPPGSLSNDFALALSRWQAAGNVTNVPKATTSFNDFYYTLSSANFFKANYFRLKNVSLSYTFPTDWLKNNKLTALRIYAQAENLLTIWDRNAALYDPESGASANVQPMRTITLGIQITL